MYQGMYRDIGSESAVSPNRLSDVACHGHVVSPRMGGEAEKFGNRFEGRWTVHWMLSVLHGRCQSIVIEERGEHGEGVEFVVVGNDGQADSHQVKRQRGNRNGWSLRELSHEGVLDAAAAQIGAGRRFWFVSLVPVRDLDELCDQARGSDNVDVFRDSLSEELGAKFAFLSGKWGEPQRAFEILQKVFVESPSERHLRATNAAMAGLLLDGAPGRAAAASLAELASEEIGRTLDAYAITEALVDYELSVGGAAANPKASAEVADTLAAWTRSIERELLDPEIIRDEAGQVVEQLGTGQSKVLLVAGAAGHGKSAVLHQAVRELTNDWPVAAMRVDSLGSFASTHALGVSLGLGSSPVAALASAAKGQDCLLVVDQLDALSLVSGRLPERFDRIVDLIDEATAFPAMRVLLACRQFDIDNDHRLQRLVSDEGPAEQMVIEPLTWAQVEVAVAEMGLDPALLNETQRELLKVPLHLVLLSAIADQPTALGFSTAKGLMDAFYERKRTLSQARREQAVRFDETVGVIVEDMSSHQRLYGPEVVVEVAGYAPDAHILESEHVLVKRTEGYSFFHEAFFDYAFARRWLARDQTLVAFLLEGEQELFRRAQVRQVLIHLRADQPERFVAEVEGLLSDDAIRFHIKEVVLALLRSIEDPTQAEWQFVEHLLESDPAYVDRICQVLRTPSWFDRLDAEGVITDWLGRDEEHAGHVAGVMTSVARERPDRLAEIFRFHEEDDTLHGVLRNASFYVDLHTSRTFFELVLDAIRSGVFDEAEHNLFMGAHGLGEAHPEWAVELLRAWFVERTDVLAVGADGKIAALDGRDHGMVEIVSAAAEQAPGPFVEFAVPLLLDAMAATSGGERRLKRDKHFGYRVYNNRHHDVDDALLYGARDALRTLVVDGEHEQVAPLFDTLAADDHDAAQWLLYEAMAADGETYVDRAVDLLTQGENRLLCGYTDNSYWSAHELTVSIGPYLSIGQRGALEDIFIAFRPEFESQPLGRGSFTMLSALPEDQLSEGARGRLRELRRVFGKAPRSPMGIRTGAVASPIPESAAKKMSDEQWLRAIAKHDGESRDWAGFTGGAREFARVLQTETATDPERYGRLALKLDDQSNPAYLNAVLGGLREAQGVRSGLVFEVMRHVASLGRSDHDQALPDALRQILDADLPNDIIEIVLEIARGSADPADEAWQREAWNGDLYYNGDPFSNGMNTARGSAALVLGDLLVHDVDGVRTGLVAPYFNELATDPSLAVRSCVAHLLAAGLRYAREDVGAAFPLLLDAPDELLGTRPVEDLVVYLGTVDNALVRPIVERMMSSQLEETQQVGGQLAAYAGLELELPELLDVATQAAEIKVRKGAASVCAHRLPITAESRRAGNALMAFFDDEEEVRGEAADVAGVLRNHPLAPHKEVVDRMISSPTFEPASTQLLITLDYATERVDDFVLRTTRRFIEVYGGQLNNVATHAAADVGEVGKLLLRAYAQAEDAAARSDILDLIDDLLIEAAYGFDKIVGETER